MCPTSDREECVYLLFREVASTSPSQFGPDRPLIGVVRTEREAREAEAEVGRDVGFHWIKHPYASEGQAGLEDFVWLAVDADPVAGRPQDDTEPLEAFSSRSLARDWLAHERSIGHRVAIWKLPLGKYSLDEETWTEEAFSSSDAP